MAKRFIISFLLIMGSVVVTWTFGRLIVMLADYTGPVIMFIAVVIVIAAIASLAVAKRVRV